MMKQPDVISLQIPNPFSEGKNRVYLIGSTPVAMIDTGVATSRGFQVLVDQLALHGLTVQDIGLVILTHKHIDHIGNAWRIQRESGARILIHESEVDAISDVDPQSRQFNQLVMERLSDWQVPHDVYSPGSHPATRAWQIESASATGVVDGQRLDVGSGELEVLCTPGHTAGSICLRMGRTLFSGDHVLPDISPNVGAGDMRLRGLLKRYLSSLEKTTRMAPDIDCVRPGHGEPFQDLAARCNQLRLHHVQRLNQTVHYLRTEPHSAYTMAKCLFGEMQDFHLVLGCAEAQAHLDYLVEEGSVRCAQGIYSMI